MPLRVAGRWLGIDKKRVCRQRLALGLDTRCMFASCDCKSSCEGAHPEIWSLYPFRFHFRCLHVSFVSYVCLRKNIQCIYFDDSEYIWVQRLDAVKCFPHNHTQGDFRAKWIWKKKMPIPAHRCRRSGEGAFGSTWMWQHQNVIGIM